MPQVACPAHIRDGPASGAGFRSLRGGSLLRERTLPSGAIRGRANRHLTSHVPLVLALYPRVANMVLTGGKAQWRGFLLHTMMSLDGFIDKTRRAATRRHDGGAVDRDALLRATLPARHPATTDVVRAINAWLDDAERLADEVGGNVVVFAAGAGPGTSPAAPWSSRPTRARRGRSRAATRRCRGRRFRLAPARSARPARAGGDADRAPSGGEGWNVRRRRAGSRLHSTASVRCRLVCQACAR
jgi:hypothetical protein